MVCFRYVIVNTLHKGDNEDDGDYDGNDDDDDNNNNNNNNNNGHVATVGDKNEIKCDFINIVTTGNEIMTI